MASVDRGTSELRAGLRDFQSPIFGLESPNQSHGVYSPHAAGSVPNFDKGETHRSVSEFTPFLLPPPVPDPTPPIITFDLPDGSTIYKHTTIDLTVNDVIGLKLVIISVGLGKFREVVWDGTKLQAPYLRSNLIQRLATYGLVQVPIMMNFQVNRDAGWPTNPDFAVTAIDVNGNVANYP